MRVLLVTDSLGSPREQVTIDYVWTEKLMQKYSYSGILFYTIIRHGLDTSQIENIKSDICVCHFGIVDCSRRCFPHQIEKILFNLPMMGKLLVKYANKYHYEITKRRNYHRVAPEKFRKNIRKISDCIKNGGGEIFLFEFAYPGEFLMHPGRRSVA